MVVFRIGHGAACRGPLHWMPPSEGGRRVWPMCSSSAAPRPRKRVASSLPLAVCVCVCVALTISDVKRLPEWLASRSRCNASPP
eukprot:5681295-Pyramimonas_sp.AAC.1